MKLALSSSTFEKMISSILLTFALMPLGIAGHGYLRSPRSRSLYSQEEGTWQNIRGVPRKESEPQSFQSKKPAEVCGEHAGRNYDRWIDSTGYPMPWKSQAIYTEGQEIMIESQFTMSHFGHIEIYVCPNGSGSNQNCMFDHPATMIEDLTYGTLPDSRFPERGFIGPGLNFKHKYRLPMGVYGNKVLLQWRYVTANSCIPEGYVSLFSCDLFLFLIYLTLAWFSQQLLQSPFNLPEG